MIYLNYSKYNDERSNSRFFLPRLPADPRSAVGFGEARALTKESCPTSANCEYLNPLKPSPVRDKTPSVSAAS